jgi:hypothetical protein
MDLLNQKESLSTAINKAKVTCGLDIDGSVSLNKMRQSINSVFANMANIKATEKTTNGRSYKFNVAGDQVPYTYEIKEVTTIDFDRTKVKAVAKKLIKEADEISAIIDKLMIDTEVDYEPIYDVNDSYEDVLSVFASH